MNEPVTTLKPARINTVRIDYLVCPSCGHDKGFICTHLREEAISKKTSRRFGPWYCDQCGNSINGMVQVDGSVLTEPRTSTKEDRAVLLVLPVSEDENLYLVVKGMSFIDEKKPETVEEARGHKRYFYEEHTCPTNYFHNTLVVISDTKRGACDDPHGVFDYVADIQVKGNEQILGMNGSSDSGQGDEILALFGVQPRHAAGKRNV